MRGAALAAVAALAAGVGVVAFSGSASAKERKRGPKPPNAATHPQLFDRGPDGTTAFKPTLAAHLLQTTLAARGFEPSNVQPDAIELTGELRGGHGTPASDWVRAMNETMTILAARWLVVPIAPPPDGPPQILIAVEPGDEAAMTGDESPFAVLFFAGALDEAEVPIEPPPPGVLDDLLPDEPDVVLPPPVVPPPVVPPPPGLPPNLQGMLDNMLDDPNASPEQLDAAADILDDAGFPEQAELLRARADAIRLEDQLEAASKGLDSFKVGNDAQPLPSVAAEHYTGDFRRWVELPSVNPQLKITTKNGQPFGISPWAGQTVKLPPDWDALKGPPPGGSAGPTFPSPGPGGGNTIPPGPDPFETIPPFLGQFDPEWWWGDEELA